MSSNSNKEIEVKVLDVDKKNILDKLKKFKPKKVFDGVMKSIFFDNASDKLKRENKLLRIRAEAGKNILCYKEKVSNKGIKVSKEYELEIDNIAATRNVFASFEYLPDLEYRKRRKSYEVIVKGHKVKLEFDKYLGNYKKIPEFVEIESDSEESIKYFLNYLKIDKHKIKSWSTVKLMRYYKLR